MPVFGKHQRKILLLLEAGVALSLSGSPRTCFRIIRECGRELRRIEARALREAIRKLYENKLVDARDNPDGSTTITLTQEGKYKALTYKLDAMEIKRPASWDKKWRVILFDIPEKRRKLRDALRRHFRELGCYELQKSVFVHPFECRDEIDFLIEFYHTRPFVRFLVAEHIDNARHLEQKFRLHAL